MTKPNASSQRRKAKLLVAKEDILTRLRRCEEQLGISGMKCEDGLGSGSLESSQGNVAVKQHEVSPRGSRPGPKMINYVNKYNSRSRPY